MTLWQAERWVRLWASVLINRSLYVTQLVSATNVNICRQCGERHGIDELPSYMRKLPKAELLIAARRFSKIARRAGLRHSEAVDRVQALSAHGQSAEALLN